MKPVPVIDGKKACSKCKKNLPSCDFANYARSSTGLQSRCRGCSKDGALEWDKKNPEKAKERFQRHQRSERRGKWLSAWQKNNRELISLYARSYYARKKNAEGSHTVAEILELFKRQMGICAICKDTLDPYHVDHIVPLSKGGGDGIENIQLLCVPCNTSKGARPNEVVLKERGRRGV